MSDDVKPHGGEFKRPPGSDVRYCSQLAQIVVVVVAIAGGGSSSDLVGGGEGGWIRS